MIAPRAVRANLVVGAPRAGEFLAHIIESEEHRGMQAGISCTPVEPFEKAVPNWFPWPNTVQLNAVSLLRLRDSSGAMWGA